MGAVGATDHNITIRGINHSQEEGIGITGQFHGSIFAVLQVNQHVGDGAIDLITIAGSRDIDRAVTTQFKGLIAGFFHDVNGDSGSRQVAAGNLKLAIHAVETRKHG